MININLNILMAAVLITPKADIRYYLNGVNIDSNGVTATDGHRLFRYNLEDTFQDGSDNQFNDEFESFIIPRDSLVQMNRSLTVRERKSAMIKITKDDDHYQMTCGNSIVCFHPIDGKYPDYKKVIPGEYKAKKKENYNWSYMYDFQKIAVLLGDKFGQVSLKPNGNNAALATIKHDDNATCVIMAMRD